MRRMKRQAASALVAIFLMVSQAAQALVAAAAPCVEDFAGSAALLDARYGHDDAAPAVVLPSGQDVPEHCLFCTSGTCRSAPSPAMVTRFDAPPYTPPESLWLAEPVAKRFVSPLFERLRPPD